MGICHRYRFLELYYRRSESSHKSGKSLPSRVESVVLYLPDVWRCVPTRLEWDTLNASYKRQLERKLTRGNEHTSTDNQQQQQQQQPDSTAVTPATSEVVNKENDTATSGAAEQKALAAQLYTIHIIATFFILSPFI